MEIDLLVGSREERGDALHVQWGGEDDVLRRDVGACSKFGLNRERSDLLVVDTEEREVDVVHIEVLAGVVPKVQRADIVGRSKIEFELETSTNLTGSEPDVRHLVMKLFRIGRRRVNDFVNRLVTAERVVERAR